MRNETLNVLDEQLEALGCSKGKSPARDSFPPALSPELDHWASHVRTEIDVQDAHLVPLDSLRVSDAIAQVDGNWVARFRGLFAGLSLIVESDEGGIMASWAPLASGSSQTYQVHQDEWAASKGAPSVGGALQKCIDSPLEAFSKEYTRFDKVARKEKHAPVLDPSALWKASEWLVDVFLDISVKDLDTQLKAALPYKLWEENKSEVGTWPQLANYWLLAHWAFGNDEALADTLERSKNAVHPATKEIRGLVSQGTFPDADRIENKRQTLLAMAASKALSPEAKKRRKSLEKELSAESAEVVAARKALESDPSAKQALDLFSELQQLSAKDPWASDVYKRCPHAMRDFAEAVDDRWLPILLHHQRLAARFIDTHKLAIPGLILALAKLSKDYATFRGHLDRFGTGAFGIRRTRELAIATGEFISEPAALEWLVDDAKSWAERIDEWDVPVSPAFEHVLLHHGIPETFALINRVLSAREFHSGNWRICVATAIAAGRLKAKPTADALKNALDRGLGREDNGEREAVRKALVEVTSS